MFPSVRVCMCVNVREKQIIHGASVGDFPPEVWQDEYRRCFISPPSLPFWIQTFISHKVDVKECVLSFVSCPYARYERLSEKPVLLAYSCTSHSVAYLNVSRICKLTLINGFNRKDFLFLFHENKRQGINRVISIQALSNEPLQNSKHAICG